MQQLQGNADDDDVVASPLERPPSILNIITEETTLVHPFSPGEQVLADLPGIGSLLARVLACHPSGLEAMIQYTHASSTHEMMVETWRLSRRPPPLPSSKTRLSRLLHVNSKESLLSGSESDVRPFDSSDLESPRYRALSKDLVSPQYASSQLRKQLSASLPRHEEMPKKSPLSPQPLKNLAQLKQQLESRMGSTNSMGSGVVSAFDSASDIKNPSSSPLSRASLLGKHSSSAQNLKTPERLATSSSPSSTNLNSSSLMGFSPLPLPPRALGYEAETSRSFFLREPVALAFGNTDFQGILHAQLSPTSPSVAAPPRGSPKPPPTLEGYPLSPALELRRQAFMTSREESLSLGRGLDEANDNETPEPAPEIGGGGGLRRVATEPISLVQLVATAPPPGPAAPSDSSTTHGPSPAPESFSSPTPVLTPPPPPLSSSTPRRHKSGFAFSGLDTTLNILKQKLFRRPSSGSKRTPLSSKEAVRAEPLAPLPDDRRTVASASVGTADEESADLDTSGLVAAAADVAEDVDELDAPSQMPDVAPLVQLVQLAAEADSHEPCSALLFSSPDLGDGETIGAAIAEAYERSNHSERVLFVLERWLIEFGGLERLRLSGEAVLSRIRRILVAVAHVHEEERERSEDSSLASVAGSSDAGTVIEDLSVEVEDKSELAARAHELLLRLAQREDEILMDTQQTRPVLRSSGSVELLVDLELHAPGSLRRAWSAPELLSPLPQSLPMRMRASSAGTMGSASKASNDETEETAMQMLALVEVLDLTDETISLDEALYPSLGGDSGQNNNDPFEVPEVVSSPTSRKSSDAHSSGGVISPRASQSDNRRLSFGSQRRRRRSTNLSFSSWGNFSMGNSLMSENDSMVAEAKMAALPPLAYRKDVCRFPAAFIAEQLTLIMCRCSYKLISRSQLRTASARKYSAPVQRLVRFFEVLSYWPLTEILRDAKRRASDRIDMFGYFVSLAVKCRELGNYHAVFALTGALSSPLLAWVHEIAHRKDKTALSSLKRLVSTQNNYRVYLADLTKCDPDKPYIPYLGLLNRSLLVLEMDAPVLVGGHVNFLRCWKIWTVIGSFLAGQRPMDENKSFAVHPSVRRVLAASMSKTVLSYVELSEMSAKAKAAYSKSVTQRTFHQARVWGHLIEPKF